MLPGAASPGTRAGRIPIPAHPAREVVAFSEDIRLRDAFGKRRPPEGRYTPGQVDGAVWAPEIEADYRGCRGRRGA